MSIIGSEPVAAAGGSHFQHAVAMLGRRGDRWARVAQALIVGAAAHELGTKLHGKARERLSYTVSVPSSDDAYADLHAWLLDSLPSKRRKALTARTARPSRGAQPVDVDGSPPAKNPLAKLLLYYDGKTAQTITLAGHRVKVAVVDDTMDRNRNMTLDEMLQAMSTPERMVFTCSGEAARDAVLDFVRTVAQARQEQSTTRFYIADRWGGWNRRRDLASRPLGSVVLRDGQAADLVADLAKFLASEELYVRVGLPWHRGYLFHGPPGTGKTSLAKALAEHFELDVHYVPLSDIKADTNLLQLLSSVDARSMLVLEDLDVVHGAKSRDDAEGGERVSLSGLLNALDGFATPHGLITVMTTNHLDALDPALVRAGRADRVEQLGYLDDDQLQRLGALVTGFVDVLSCSVGRAEITHAELIEAAKPWLDDPAAAVNAMELLVHDRRSKIEPEAYAWPARKVRDNPQA